MKRVIWLLLVVCVLTPATARADDGGWWDVFWKWDTRFVGASSEIHLLCLDGQGRRVIGCEEWFQNFGRLILKGKGPEHNFRVVKDPNATRNEDKFERLKNFNPIKHEVDFHFGYQHSWGDRYDTDKYPAIGGAISAWKLMAMYHWHPADHVALGGGLGNLIISGDRFDTFSRSLITPASLIVYGGGLAYKLELKWIPGGFTSADFGDPGVGYSRPHDWNLSVAIGFDLRRLGSFESKRP